MVNALAVELGLMTQEQSDLIGSFLKRHNLPTTYEIKEVDAFYEKLFLDKKAAHNKLKFILPQGIGGHLIRDDIPEAVVKKVLKAF